MTGPRVFTVRSSDIGRCPEQRMDPRPTYRSDGRCLHRDPEPCQWFALCDNPASVLVPHPVLGDVPTCPRCADRATGEDR